MVAQLLKKVFAFHGTQRVIMPTQARNWCKQILSSNHNGLQAHASVCVCVCIVKCLSLRANVLSKCYSKTVDVCNSPTQPEGRAWDWYNR
jgi:hypothetical protein